MTSTLTITYFNRSGNAGHLTLDLRAALPAKVADFKRVLSFLSLASDPDKGAEVVHQYIKEQVEQLQEQRAEIDPERKAVEVKKINNQIKAFTRNASALVSIYTDLSPIEDTEPERCEIIPKGETSMTYEKGQVTIDGTTYRAEYELHESGAVYVHRFTGYSRISSMVDIDSPYYPAALEACKTSDDIQAPSCDPEPEPEAIQEPAADPEPAPIAIPEPVENPKAAHGPVPEKVFIGQQITGNGWRIFFDPDASRTRVIFQETPSAAAKAAVEDAGFYYSGKMNSWNKKLTFRAYRAAKKLSDELNKICAA